MDNLKMPPVERKAPTEAMIEKVVMDTISKYQATYGLNLRSQEVSAIVKEVAGDVSKAFAYYARQFDISPKEVRNTVTQLLDKWDKTGKPPPNAFAEVREYLRQVQPKEFKEYQAAAIASARKTDAEIAKLTSRGMTRDEALFRIAYEKVDEERRKKMPGLYAVEDVYPEKKETKIAEAEKPERMKHPSESLIIPEHKKEMTPREERAARREEKKREGEAAEAQARAEARAEREQREEQRKADAAARSAAREQKGRTISNEELASQLAKAAMAKMGGAMGGKTTREVLAGGTKPSAPPPVAIAETKKSEPAQPKIKPAKEGEVAEIGQMRMSGGDINVKTEGPGEERAQKARKAERKEAGVAVLSPTQEVEKRLDSVAQSLGADSYESLYKRQKMEALNMVRDQIRNDITATQTQIRREPQNKAALEDDIARNRKLLDALSKISA